MAASKLDRINTEILRTREKMSELQARLRELERQKTETENTEYVAIVRSMNITPQELAEFIKGMQAKPAGSRLLEDAMPGFEKEGANEE